MSKVKIDGVMKEFLQNSKQNNQLRIYELRISGYNAIIKLIGIVNTAIEYLIIIIHE